MIEYEDQLKTYTYDIETVRSHHKGKDGKYKTVKYCNNIFTFDIECTSAWLENDQVIGYRTGMDNDYWNDLQPLALCYLWQFSLPIQVRQCMLCVPKCRDLLLVK